MKESMRALVYTGPRRMIIQEQAVPLPAKNEVLIQVKHVGICGSELSGYVGANSLRKPPLIMGHEFSGIVVQSEGNGVIPGQRVTVNPLITCGKCVYCQKGEHQRCYDRALLGAHRPGAFAEYIAVPRQNVYPIAESLQLDDAAMTEPMACAVHVIRQLPMDDIDNMLIIGAGPIGLLILQAAQIHRVRNVVVMDISPKRLQIVQELGGTPATSSAAVDRQTLNHGFDAAVDAVGKTVTRQMCLDLVRHGGTVAMTGLHEGSSLLNINDVIRKEVQIHGAFAYTPDDFATALQWNEQQRMTLRPWTKNDRLSRGSQYFEGLVSGKETAAKILLQPEW